MQSPAQPQNENERLHAVQSLNILDTPNEERFDRLTRIAADTLAVPICTISIVDSNREWFKSCVGSDIKEGGRDVSFCGHTILQGNIFIIEDTLADARFADNPQVTNPPHVRFYAGVTLHDHTTHLPVGAFCIKDTKPRKLSLDELNMLMEFAKSAEFELNSGLLEAPPMITEGRADTDDQANVHTMWLNRYGSAFGQCE